MSTSLIPSQESRYTRVKNPRLDIIHQLAALISYFNRRSCYPSQETLCEMVAKHCQWKASRRTLCRHLKGLEQDGFIRRIRRHRHVEGKGLEMHSTCYVLTKKAWRWIAKLSGAIKAAVSWGRERVTHSSQYNPLRGVLIAAGPSAPARQERKSPPDGGGGKKPATATAFNALQSLREVLNRGRR